MYLQIMNFNLEESSPGILVFSPHTGAVPRLLWAARGLRYRQSFPIVKWFRAIFSLSSGYVASAIL